METYIVWGTAPVREHLCSSIDFSGAMLFIWLKDVTYLIWDWKADTIKFNIAWEGSILGKAYKHQKLLFKQLQEWINFTSC